MSGQPPKAPTGSPPADDLAQRGEVGTHAETLLSASPGDAEGDDLVEDEHDAVALGDGAQPLEEALRGRNDAADAQQRIDQDGGELARFLLDDLLAGLGIVPGQHDHVLEHGRRNPGRRRHRLGPAAASGRLHVGSDAHQHPVVGAVIRALELGDLGPSREGSGRADRIHGGLGARVREAHAFQRRHSPRQHLGQANLVLRGARKGQAEGGGVLRRLHHVRMGVAQDEARVVAVEVQAVHAVHVPDVRALSPLDVEGIGIEEGRGPAVAARHDGHGIFVQAAGPRGLGQVLVQLSIDAHYASILGPGARSRSEHSSRSARWASASVTARKRTR